MTEIKMVGDTEGIKLWNLMASTTDKAEREYFERLNAAASKFGSVWFTDTIAERDMSHSQAIFSLKWNSVKNQWIVSLFHIPDGATKEIEERLETIDIDDAIELD